jgi:type II secretory pathway predicted ATPase ExeA
MYETWFRFTQRPFTTAPQLSEYFAASAVEAAVRTMGRCIGRGSGPAVLVGPPGTGKTVLAMKLHATFCSRMPTANICCSGLGDRRSFLQAVLFEFGRPYRQLDDGELRLSLVDYLTSRDATHNGALCILDDAHFLPSEALDEIRMLSNLVRNGKWCAHLVLTGTSLLEESLHTAQMESFQQRIAARCYLEPFRREETVGYIRQSISRANGQVEEIFTADALARVHELTRGIPRLINQVCDHALLLAAIGHHHQLAAAGIEEAWRDLQQLPEPAWETAPISSANVVEFGNLDSEQDSEELSLVEEDAVAFESDETLELWQGPSSIVPPHFPMANPITDTDPHFDNDVSAPYDSNADESWGLSAEPTIDELHFQDPVESIKEVAAPQDDAIMAPDDRLTEIEAKLALLTQELSHAPHDTPAPIAEATPVLPMVAENPFLDEFDSEELVVDRMGSLRHTAILKQPRVVSQESHDFASQLGPGANAEPQCDSAEFTFVDNAAEISPEFIDTDESLPTQPQACDEAAASDDATDDYRDLERSTPEQSIESSELEQSDEHASARFIPLVTWGKSYDIPIVPTASRREAPEPEFAVTNVHETAMARATQTGEQAADQSSEEPPALTTTTSSSSPGQRRFGKLFANLQSR